MGLAPAQVIQPMFERHTIVVERYSVCASTVRATNVITTADATVPIALSCANRGTFNGNVTLTFPGATLVNDEYRATVSTSGGTRFFRLRHP